MSERNPHDSLVRRLLSQQELAAAGLSLLLPDTVVSSLDMATVHLTDGSFVDEALKDRRTDLLFELQSHSASPKLIYVLLEHQSSVDPEMPWRLFQYAGQIWARWKTDHAGESGVLPEIIPLVLYHGQRRWSAPTTLSEMMRAGVGEWLEPPAIELSFHLLDLSQLTEQEVIQRSAGTPPELPLLLLHLKTMAWVRDVLVAVRRWAPLYVRLLRAPGRRGRIAEFLRYTLLTHRGLDSKGLVHDVLTTIEAMTGEDLMQQYGNPSLEALEAQVRIDFTMRLLARKFPDQAEAARPRVEAASTEALERVIDRFLEANTVDELFADD